MAYIMRIDTMKYKDHKNISRKNWEPGTMDDYMHAINGISRRLRSEREVLWQSSVILFILQPDPKEGIIIYWSL